MVVDPTVILSSGRRLSGTRHNGDPAGILALMSLPTAPPDVLRTVRLDLVTLPLAWVEALAAGEHTPDLGFTDTGFLSAGSSVIGYRLEQLRADPRQAPWLLRAIVERASRAAVGYVNFHAPPDERGMVEIGYQVVPAHRRRGIAAEAAAAMWAEAARHGATVLRASVAPDNVPSLALIRRAGFVHVGEQMDEIDGLELLFERPA